MNYSWNLILERSGIKSCDLQVGRIHPDNLYGRLRIRNAETVTNEENVIWIADAEEFRKGQPGGAEHLQEQDLLVLTDLTGRVSLGDLQDLSCDYLLLHHYSLGETYNLLANALDSITDCIQAFRDAVIGHVSLQQLIEMFYDYLGNPAYIVDSSFKVLAVDRRNHMRELSAVWRRLEDHGYLPYEVINNLIESRELMQMESGRDAEIIYSHYFYTPFINYNLRRKGRLLGHLFMVRMLKDITPGDIEICNILGRLISQAMAADRKYQTERGEYYEYFLADIFAGKLKDPEEVRKQMKALNYEEDHDYILAVLMSEDQQMSQIEEGALFSHLERLRGCKPIHYEGKIVLLIPMRKTDNDRKILAEIERMAKELHFHAGVSESFHGYPRLRSACLQAMKAYERSSAEEGAQQAAYYPDYAMTCFLEGAFTEELLEMMTPAGIDHLIQYDRTNETDYVRTLYVYLLHERNMNETAEILFIHRNSLAYRLRKVREVTGFDLDDPDLRMRLLLTLSHLSGAPFGSFADV